MTESVRHHPEQTLLGDFLSGSLPMGVNLAVSSHIDQCGECLHQIGKLVEVASQKWTDDFAGAGQNSGVDLSGMLDYIVEQPATSVADPKVESWQNHAGSVFDVHLRERQIKLPRLLARIAGSEVSWKEIANGIHQALLDVDPLTKCELIYMDPGAKVPEHTHLGNEFMLVLDGTLIDDLGSYGTGDFVARDRQDRHSQTTEEGCICLFVTDAPLHFTQGMARWLNPLNRLRFWRSKLSPGRMR